MLYIYMCVYVYKVSLFSLAIPCNLPELQEERDVMWIYEKLMVIGTKTYVYIHKLNTV